MAFGVQVVDTLALGTQVVKATVTEAPTPSQTPVPTIQGRTAKVNVGTLPGNGSVTVQIEASLTKTVSLVSNTGTVTSTSPDSNPNNNSASASVTVAR